MDDIFGNVDLTEDQMKVLEAFMGRDLKDFDQNIRVDDGGQVWINLGYLNDCAHVAVAEDFIKHMDLKRTDVIATFMHSMMMVGHLVQQKWRAERG